MNIIEAGPGRRKRWKKITHVNLGNSKVSVNSFNDSRIFNEALAFELVEYHDKLISGGKNHIRRQGKILEPASQINLHPTVKPLVDHEYRTILPLDEIAKQVFQNGYFVESYHVISSDYSIYKIPGMKRVDMVHVSLPSHREKEYPFDNLFGPENCLEKEKKIRDSFHMEIFFKRGPKKYRESLYIPLSYYHNHIPVPMKGNEFCIFHRKYEKSYACKSGDEYYLSVVQFSIVNSTHYPEKIGPMLKAAIND